MRDNEENVHDNVSRTSRSEPKEITITDADIALFQAKMQTNKRRRTKIEIKGKEKPKDPDLITSGGSKSRRS